MQFFQKLAFCPSTRYEYDYWQQKCICDHSMLFYGVGCSLTNIFVKISFAILVCLSLVGLFVSINVFISKWNDSRRKSVATVTTAMFSVVGDISSTILCTSNFLRPSNVGNQALEANFINPISISALGMSTIFCCLNVCLLWIDLSVETKSPSNLKKSMRVLIVIGFTYILLFSVTYTVTKQVTWCFF